MSAGQLAKYEAWILELESRQKDIAQRRAGLLRLFVGLMIASTVGFYWGVWIGVGALLTGFLMCVFGFYTVLFREGEYVKELAALRRTAGELRSAQPPAR